MRILPALWLIVLGSCAMAQSTQPEVVKTITAEESFERWDGWAKDSRSRPGWGNVPPEPGTVTIVKAEPKQPRIFSGKVEGLDDLTGAEVGIVSLSYIYWIRQKETFHWSPVAADGTFSVTENTFLDENKSVVLRAPKRPMTILPYIFKAPEGGKDIVLKAEPYKAVRVTAELSGQPLKSFGVELFALNETWKHENNPAGYHWHSRQWTPKDADELTLYLPLHPIGAYVNGQGAAAHWEVIDAREFDRLHLVLLPAAQLKLTVTKDGAPLPKFDAQTGNETAAFSLRSGKTNDAGVFEVGGMAAGTWWLRVNKKTVEFDIKAGQTLNATFDTNTNQFTPQP